MNKDIKNIVGKYLLPSIESVKIKKRTILPDLSHQTINIIFYLNNNLVSPDGGYTYRYCNNFTNKKYKHTNNTYWTIRDN